MNNYENKNKTCKVKIKFNYEIFFFVKGYTNENRNILWLQENLKCNAG